jgi:hypothetical protein
MEDGADQRVIVAIPIKDRAAVAKLAGSELKKLKTEGDVTQYQPKRPGAKPFWMQLTDKHVLMGDTAKVFKALAPHVKTTLLAQTPKTDVEINVMLQNIGKLQRDLDMVVRMAMLKAAANPKFEKSAAGAMESWMNDIIGLIKGASSMRLTMNIEKSGLQFAAHVVAKDGSPLHARIKKEQPGAPFGHELFPAKTPLLTASAGGGSKQGGMLDIFKLTLDKSLGPKQGAAIAGLINELQNSLSRTATWGLYRGKKNSVVMLSVVKAKDGAKAVAAVEKGIKVMRGLIKEKEGAAGLKKIDSLGIKSAAFKHGNMAGKSHRLGLTKVIPKNKLADVKQMGFKPKVGIAYAGGGDRMVFCVTIGDDVNAELKTVLDGKRPKLADSAAFKAMLGRADRTMWLYLSAVDIVRALDMLPPVKPMAKMLASVEVQKALTVDWGVNSARNEYNGRLDIPAKHLLHFKPMLMMLAKRKR